MMWYMLQDIVGYICIFLYPAFALGPALTLILAFGLFKAKSRGRRMLLSICLLIISCIQVYSCYLVWPLDLLPSRKDAIIRSVVIEKYKLTLLQKRRGGGIYFLIQREDGDMAMFPVTPESYKVWCCELVENAEMIYYRMNSIDIIPCVNKRTMTISNGDSVSEEYIPDLYEDDFFRISVTDG